VSAWTHVAGFVLALPGTLILWRRGGGDVGKQLSLLVYGFCLAACYGASTLYHGVRVPAASLALFVRLDSVGIFLLIAGTYTPMAWNLLRGRWRAWTLALVWGGTGAALVLLASGRPFSRLLGTCVYLAMGWGAIVCYVRIARVVSYRALWLVVAGGVFYSVGAVLNLLHWPGLWPGSFDTHDLFHLFVLAGSLAHYWFLLKIVAPFDYGTCMASHQSESTSGVTSQSWPGRVPS
jgi:hemolysin III